MIWDLISDSPLDKYWSDPSLKLTTLLLDENIITQLKNQNPKLLEYLESHKQQFMDELIEYSTIMPTEEDTYDRANKLPYISSELLALDSQLIHGEFFKEGVKEEDNHNWKRLIQFLDTEAAQNQILMGYFEKIITNLYNANKEKTTHMVSAHIDQFMKHICSGSVGDILKNCIILLYTPEQAVLPERVIILNRVVETLISQNEETKSVCADILKDVINKFQAFSSGDYLIEILLNNSKLEGVYQIETSSAVNNLLVALVKKSQQTTVNEKDETVHLLDLPAHHKQKISEYLKRQTQNIDKLTTSNQYLLNQHRVTVRKSNKKIYELLALVGLSIEEGQWSFLGSKLISNLWNLLVLYPYNNILQVSVLKIFINILQKGDEHIRNLFLNHYESYMLELYRQNSGMFRPVVFSVWKEAKKYPSVTKNEVILSEFKELVENHLQNLLKYEVKSNVPQVRQGQKLIVDEEDAANNPTRIKQNQMINVNQYISDNEKIEKNDQLEDLPLETIQSAKEKQENNTPFDWFSKENISEAETTGQKDNKQFNFFESWSPEKPVQATTEKKQNKNFDDFASFF